MIYLVILIIISVLLIREIKKNKRKITRKSKFLTNLTKLPENKYFKFLFYKKNTKRYKKLNKYLKEAGLKVSVWQFQAIRYFIILCFIGLGFLISITNFYLKIQENIPTEFSVFKVILMAIILGFVIFKLALYFLLEYKKGKTHKELLMLQTYTIVMLKTGNSVKNILIALMERSNIYKPYFEDTIKNYSNNPLGSLQNLKEETNNVQFQKIVIALEQALNNDKSMSILYLDTNRRFDKELIKIRQKEMVGNKKVVGFLVLLAPLISTFLLAGYPWFEMVIRNLSSGIF